MLITTQMLRDKNACESQVEIFAKQWPEGAEVTRENCLVALALGLDVRWAGRLLVFLARTAYNKAEAEAEAWKVYNEVVAPAWKVYNEALATAFCDAAKKEEAK